MSCQEFSFMPDRWSRYRPTKRPGLYQKSRYYLKSSNGMIASLLAATTPGTDNEGKGARGLNLMVHGKGKPTTDMQKPLMNLPEGVTTFY